MGWYHMINDYEESTKNAFQCLKYCFTATSLKNFQIISFTKNCLALIEKASCIRCFQV